MKQKELVSLAAKSMGITEKHLKNCVTEYLDGYFFWEPVGGGKTVFIDHNGDYLVNDGSETFKTHYNNFRKGKRTNKPVLEDVLSEIEDYFSI